MKGDTLGSGEGWLMRSILRLIILLLFFLCGLGGALAAETPVNAGFETVTIPDGAGPGIEAGIWYPTDAPASPQRLGGWSQTVAPRRPGGTRTVPADRDVPWQWRLVRGSL